MSDDKSDSKTILVVDDVSDNRILMSLSLQDMGYRVLTACDGEEAVSIALLARPNLILMDIAMPQLDGLGATRRIREQVELQHVPVVAITAFDTSGFRRAAFDAGFDGYLTKPIDFERMATLIDRLLSGQTTSEIGHEQTTEIGDEDTTEIARHA
jgi:CheY-like chemotaxis protein